MKVRRSRRSRPQYLSEITSLDHCSVSDLPFVLTFAFIRSEPQSFPAVASGGKGCLWEGSNSGEERHRINLRLEVHPQR